MSRSQSNASVLITHTDLDGIGSAIFAISDNLVQNVYSWKTGFSDYKLLFKFQIIYVTDLALPENIIQELIMKKKQVIILDHHESSQYITKFPNCHVNINSCGTRMFYEQVVSQKNPMRKEFVTLVDLFDRWVEKDKNFSKSCDLERLFESLVDRELMKKNGIFHLFEKGKILNSPFTKFINENIKKMSTCFDAFVFNKLENDLITEYKRKENRDYNNCLETINFQTDCKNIEFAVYKSFGNVSLIANRILRENPNLKYVIIDYGNDRFSARSKPDFDLLQLQRLQGHRNSAGGLNVLPIRYVK